MVTFAVIADALLNAGNFYRFITTGENCFDRSLISSGHALSVPRIITVTAKSTKFT